MNHEVGYPPISGNEGKTCMWWQDMPDREKTGCWNPQAKVWGFWKACMRIYIPKNCALYQQPADETRISELWQVPNPKGRTTIAPFKPNKPDGPSAA